MTTDRQGREHRGLGDRGGQYEARRFSAPESPLQGTSTDWPAVEFEQRPWHIDPSVNYISKTQARKHAGPYSAAIPPLISTLDPHLPSHLISESEEAAREIVRFDEYVSATFGSSGEIAPMGAILLRTESASSSQIENLTVGARQIALAELGENTNRNAKIVTGNVRSMEAALALAENIDEASILTMHKALLEGSQPEHAGQWRDQQVWIGGGSAGPHRADFVPPHHERVQPAIRDLLEFANRDDLPSVAQIAITHAQFETIHPFSDGNGRTGRALVHSMLTNKGLAQRITVPVSSGLLVNTDDYFAALGAYRKGDVEPIIEQFNDATIFAVGNGRRLVADLKETRNAFDDKITARSDSSAWKVADLLIGQPVINNAYVVKTLGISDMAAQRAIDHLETAGILIQPSKQGRNRTWQSPDVLAALDDFASRIRRVRG